MEAVETRLQVIEKQNQDTNQTSQQGDALESLKMKDMIKELEEKVNSLLTLNKVVDKLDIKPIKVEMTN